MYWIIISIIIIITDAFMCTWNFTFVSSRDVAIFSLNYKDASFLGGQMIRIFKQIYQITVLD